VVAAFPLQTFRSSCVLSQTFRSSCVMRAGRVAAIVGCVCAAILFVRVWILLDVWVDKAACAISPCHVCPCPPFTFFGPHANPHCPEDPADIFPPLSHHEVKTAGFLASSTLEFCSANPFIAYLAPKTAAGDHSPLYWDAEVKAEQFFRALFFSASCLTRVAKKWDKFDLFNRTLECPSLKASVIHHPFSAFSPPASLGVCVCVCVCFGSTSAFAFAVVRYPESIEDGNKFLCEVERLTSPCVIYSLGSRNNYLFENEMLRVTPCEIHTFDCTVDPVAEKDPRIRFQKVCIGARNEVIDGRPYETFSTLTKRMGHERVDLLKMDIEGFEYTVFQNWLPSHGNLPYQLVFELHLNFLTSQEAVMMLNNLFVMGYRVANRDDNVWYWEGTELTLVRTRCPHSPLSLPAN